MDPVIAAFPTAGAHFPDEDSEFDPEIELARSIRRHFGALADLLNRSADLIGDIPDGNRLRAAAAAAKRGKASADRLCFKIAEGADQPAAMQRRA